MPYLQWEPFDFFYCLEVEPEIVEYGEIYAYEVRRDNLVLDLNVRPFESVIDVSLYQAEYETPLLKCALFVRGKVQHINSKRGEYLEFSQCVMAPQKITYLEAENLGNPATPTWTVELWIKPHIQIRYRD